MLKILLCCFSFFLAIHQIEAEENLPSQPSPQVGRYQLAAVGSKYLGTIVLYLLDTETGTIWESISHGIRFREWTLVPLHLPQPFPPFPATQEQRL